MRDLRQVIKKPFLHLVRTRVLIRFTKLFWKDLGLAYVHERVQKSAKKGL
ncbi:hypothetical protein [Pseudomonas syringae]|nr:hypothetical protein [Pseudomonas syringae]MBI6741362.1 hypothetical protein [Pseudomonas syringae]MBI6762598.1 hypothetical protein [Pseudomonas syringae]MBI6828939.1 hypothetical protein [Pseudomonas syringae]